jgi:hypothetical protein
MTMRRRRRIAKEPAYMAALRPSNQAQVMADAIARLCGVGADKSTPMPPGPLLPTETDKERVQAAEDRRAARNKKRLKRWTGARG